jgi:hypothetical protein
LLLFLFASAADAGESTDAEDPRIGGPTAGGRIILVGSSELDMLGDLWVDLPLAVSRRDALVVGLDTRSSIRRPTSNFAFEVIDLHYRLDLGFRTRRGWFARRPATFFLAQRGTEAVDADGQAYVRYLGFMLESEGFRHYTDELVAAGARRPRVEWRASGGPVLEDREVEAEFMLRGDARVALGSRSRAKGPLFELEFKLDGLYGGGRFDADYAAGPALAMPVAGGKRAKFFLHYQVSDNPLGIGESAVLLGLEYSGQAGVDFVAPEIDGSLAAGGGDGREAGQLRLRFISPSFARRYRGVFYMDANVLTAEDTGELYYLFDIGVERTLGRNLAGVYFFHRSNHQLAEPNDTVTSINVLEFGYETAAWRRTGRRPVRGRWGRIDGRVAAGILLTSDFGEERRWHLRGGLRWSLPLAPRSIAPFVLAEAEAGDVERQSVAVGLSPRHDLDLQVEYRHDEHYFGQDDTAVLLLARIGFQGKAETGD